MRLTELEPQFLRYQETVENPGTIAERTRVRHAKVDTFAEADGVCFDCPLPGHGHWVITWFAGRGVPDHASPTGFRWPATGTGYHDLTLTPSIDVGDGDWHGFIRNGEVTNA